MARIVMLRDNFMGLARSVVRSVLPTRKPLMWPVVLEVLERPPLLDGFNGVVVMLDEKIGEALDTLCAMKNRGAPYGILYIPPALSRDVPSLDLLADMQIKVKVLNESSDTIISVAQNDLQQESVLYHLQQQRRRQEMQKLFGREM